MSIASFFVLANLPGSMDHFKAQTQGIPMEADYNRRDTHHVTMEHPNMTTEEWELARLKDRTTRRPGFEVDPFWAHVCKRIPEISQEVLGYARIIGQFAAIWRRTYPYEEAPVLSGFTLPQFVWYYTRSTLGW